MEYNGLTEAQKAKAKECKTPEELMALAKEEGVELTDAQLEAVAGGGQRAHGSVVDRLHRAIPIFHGDYDTCACV